MHSIQSKDLKIEVKDNYGFLLRHYGKWAIITVAFFLIVCFGDGHKYNLSFKERLVLAVVSILVVNLVFDDFTGERFFVKSLEIKGDAIAIMYTDKGMEHKLAGTRNEFQIEKATRRGLFIAMDYLKITHNDTVIKQYERWAWNEAMIDKIVSNG